MSKELFINPQGSFYSFLLNLLLFDNVKNVVLDLKSSHDVLSAKFTHPTYIHYLFKTSAEIQKVAAAVSVFMLH